MTVNQRADAPSVHGSRGDGQSDDEQARLTEGESPKLTVAALARRLGVAPATLRTWDRRYGLGPSDHASGRHRRYGSEDVARLERMQEALLRGASPSEAARYAHATGGLDRSGRSAEPGTELSGAAEDGPGGEPPEGEPVLLSGVLGGPDDGPVRPSPGPNPGGRGLRLGSAGPKARGLGRAVLALDSRSAQRLLGEAMSEDGVAETRRDVLRPVQRALTERRQRSGSGAEMVQLLTDCALTAFRAVIAGAPQPSNPRPVLLASAPGEPQELDLVAFAAALAANRVGHRLFGPALPKEGLDAAIRRAAPAAVVLWAEQPQYAAPDVIADIPNPRQRVRAFAGGAGWQADAVPRHVEVLDSWDSAVDRVTAAVLGRAAAGHNARQK